MNSENSLANARKNAAYYAVDNFVSDNTVIGLGTGRTAQFALERISQRLKTGELTNIVGIPTSDTTKLQAESLGIPLTTLDENTKIDVALDGADEVCLSTFQIVKGRGGALLREKLIEESAKQFIVMVDESKLVNKLGETGGIPVEVNCFGAKYICKNIMNCSALTQPNLKFRMHENSYFITDNNNFIIDIFLDKPLEDATTACKEIKSLTGVVEHGIFLGMATHLIVAMNNGSIKVYHER